MQAKRLVRDVFRVIAAGPWEADDFGPVEVELKATREDAFFPSRLIVRITPLRQPPITFDADGYHFEGGILRVWTGARQFRWMFRILD